MTILRVGDACGIMFHIHEFKINCPRRYLAVADFELITNPVIGVAWSSSRIGPAQSFPAWVAFSRKRSCSIGHPTVKS